MRCFRINSFQSKSVLTKQITWAIIFLILSLSIFGQEKQIKKEEPVIALVGGDLN